MHSYLQAGRLTGFAVMEPAVDLASPLPDGADVGFPLASFLGAAILTWITA